MNKYEILAQRFAHFSKYLRRLAVVCLLLFLITVSFNSEEEYMVLLSMALFMVALVGGLQSIVLLVLSKYYQSKNNI